MPHLLVTNDFPPRIGGIESMLWELWRRLPPDRVTVLTNRTEGGAEFDRRQAFRIERTPQRVLLPTPGLARRINRLAAEVDAGVVVLDPALPLGLVGSRLDRPYAVILHGAEVTVPGRLPVVRRLLARVVAGAAHVIAAGPYPAAEAARATGARMPAVTVIPPGVDAARFRPLDDAERRAARRHFGLPESGFLVVGVSRLVPRKGFDALISAVARLTLAYPALTLVIGGGGRDRGRLERRARRSGAPVRFLGRVADDDMPTLLGCGDVFAMLCRDRWGGLEQEGFGIVFVEAAACGVPQVAGASGGAADAVVDGTTGVVVRRPRQIAAVASALGRLLDDPDSVPALGRAGRARVEADFDYDLLAARLDETLLGLEKG